MQGIVLNWHIYNTVLDAYGVINAQKCYYVRKLFKVLKWHRHLSQRALRVSIWITHRRKCNRRLTYPGFVQRIDCLGTVRWLYFYMNFIHLYTVFSETTHIIKHNIHFRIAFISPWICHMESHHIVSYDGVRSIASTGCTCTVLPYEWKGRGTHAKLHQNNTLEWEEHVLVSNYSVAFLYDISPA